MRSGDLIIVPTGQSGTVDTVVGDSVWVLLRNGDVYVGPLNQCRAPQDQAELDACPVNVPRLEKKLKKER